MFSQVLVFIAVAGLASAGYLEPTLRLSVEEPSPAVSIVSPAVTRTEFVPGSYSSSFRSDVITPRLRLTETPGVSIAVPQQTVAFAPSVARFERVEVPAISRVEKIVPGLSTLERVERVVPSIAIESAPLLRSNFDLGAPLPIARGYAGLTIPITRGIATGHVF